MNYLVIIGINLTMLIVAYFFLYPTFVKNSLTKLGIGDLFLSIAAWAGAGFLFAGTDTQFSLFFVTLNWFWFSLITYLALDLILFLWYCKKYKIFPPKKV